MPLYFTSGADYSSRGLPSVRLERHVIQGGAKNSRPDRPQPGRSARHCREAIGGVGLLSLKHCFLQGWFGVRALQRWTELWGSLYLEHQSDYYQSRSQYTKIFFYALSIVPLVHCDIRSLDLFGSLLTAARRCRNFDASTPWGPKINRSARGRGPPRKLWDFSGITLR
jgi:hypothetical protein